MPAKLIDYVRNERRMKLPPEDGPADADAIASARPTERRWRIRRRAPRTNRRCNRRWLLCATGPGTISRTTNARPFCAESRAACRSTPSIRSDISGLLAQSWPPPALLHDLLIGVTHFFAIPPASPRSRLMCRNYSLENITLTRCGSGSRLLNGEEAYTIAMLLCEHASKLDHPPSIQILRPTSMKARLPALSRISYPLTIEADVSQERLRRFSFEYWRISGEMSSSAN